MDSRQRLRDLAVSESGFVFDPYGGQTYSLNLPGKVILEGLRRGSPQSEIEATLRDTFEVEPGADLARDVREFLLQVREQGWLPAGAEVP
ncbi:MAG: PqqD family protein [Anaeromyxobacter sp.]|nr:PqqD family protein [Anaeromyxobacter sp.]MBL0278513.1 PqqD family protein [Anaeromyxobacter sp.]